MHKSETNPENGSHKILVGFLDTNITSDLTIMKQKNENLLFSEYCGSCAPHHEICLKSDWDKQILRPYKRTWKAMEHEAGRDISSNWAAWNGSKGLKRSHE